MRTPLLDRRDFLAAAGAGFLAALAPRQAAALAAADAVFATACQRRDGAYGVAILSEAGEVIRTLALPERGHDVTYDPVSGRSVVFARQPGTFATVFDHRGKKEPLTIASVAGRHFYGHGVFSPDGALLYATENDFENAAGMVGVYDAGDGFRRVGEFPTHGVGPHELLLLTDGRTLAIANGGIETHPDYGRAKLNLPTMKPSFALVDRLHGELVEQCTLPSGLHQLSIRHMAIDAAEKIWFGCQYEGPQSNRPGLVGTFSRDGGLKLVELPADVLGGFRNYIGSVASNPRHGTVAVSSPQGNSYAVLDAASGAVITARSLVEVCGLAADGAGFVVTTGTGDIVKPDGSEISRADYIWDNHVLRIG